MSKFNWDDHPVVEGNAQASASGGFNWDDHPVVEDDSEPTPILDSAARKLAQGATFGFSDELAGAGEAAGRVVGVKGFGGDFKDMKYDPSSATVDWDQLKEAYKQGREHERAALKKDSKDNPGVSATAELVGSVLSPVNAIIPGGSMVKQGMAIGAAAGLGNSDADLTKGEYEKAAIDTGLGTVLGGSLGKATEAASPYIGAAANKLGGKFADMSEKFAARAMGAERATVKRLGADKVKEIGRYALDEGILSPLASTEDKVARNAVALERGGKQMGKVYDAIDEAGASTFNPLEVASKVDDKIGGFYRSPINRGETNQLENTFESILMRGEKNIPLKEAQTLKQEIGKVANWKNNLNITDKEQMARDAYKTVSKAIDDAAESGAKSIGREGLEDTLKVGKKLYSNAKGGEQLLTNKLAREQGNKIIGLTDTIAGGAGLGFGGPAGSLLAVGAKKVSEKYGAQTAAITLDKIAKTLSGSSPELANLARQNPRAFQAIVQKIHLDIGAKDLPKAAIEQRKEQEEKRKPSNAPMKGFDMWAEDGVVKLNDSLSPQVIAKLKSSQKGKELLAQASDLKPGSKAMVQLVDKIKSKYSERAN